MGASGFPNQAHQLGGNLSFAQSLTGSQPATPLDLSEFPSLANNSQLNTTGQPSLWSASGSRNPSGPVQRSQSIPVTTQPSGQDDLFNPSSSRVPPNQAANGYLRSERSANMMSSLGFAPQSSSSAHVQANKGNGLLNALSANSRANEARSPPGGASSRASDAKRPDDMRQKAPTFRDDGFGKTPAGDGAMQAAGARNQLGAIGNDGSQAKFKDDKASQHPEAVDPLAGMAAVDKWGIKGLRTLMNNYPDFHAMVVGMDPSTLGLDLSTQELISPQIYSLFDEQPPRPTVTSSKFRLPDCYSVTNVQPIESKIQSFNEETLFWLFYSCPADMKQQMAAVELHSRNWRWHKKLQIWLTKDEHMNPQILSPNHERGYYIVWDANNWRKDRREFTLHYGDLDTTLNAAPTLNISRGAPWLVYSALTMILRIGNGSATATTTTTTATTATSQHKRVYQACIPCRRRKVRCDLGSVDNPHDPPCVRCRRESKECFFSATRRKRKTDEAAEGGSDADDYMLRNGRKRLLASGSPPPPPTTTTTTGEARAGATHRLVLQDCRGTRVFAVELRRVERVGVGSTAMGEKILLRAGTVVARGTVLLAPETCLLLGGRVDAWHDVWAAGRLRRLEEAAAGD
ncbi:hypothetical protein CDD80_1970 [Ophiocordyceps camponoti-rufipedis]|uniref:Zn(2)-C6 fungal-type domain-containing protein n=1 Tax=Ophiocordyceps camponoti-rufipedis TaxID=2004952 RepID=A0A2C5ZLZ2_9HYPO|nr:hypothetical protein CDD80_1970 [Ophiocordyceps camponoti-rufipedis]